MNLTLSGPSTSTTVSKIDSNITGAETSADQKTATRPWYQLPVPPNILATHVPNAASAK